jgi:hypothetical protein
VLGEGVGEFDEVRELFLMRAMGAHGARCYPACRRANFRPDHIASIAAIL